MAAGVVEMRVWSVFGGSISVHNTEVQRKPYHKNCSCALHKMKCRGSSLFPTKKYLIPQETVMSTSNREDMPYYPDDRVCKMI
ncbi:Mucin-5AC like [Quillaja saponaria]|uniref:Mucin-5AC like n=1 Tax=Quillaja saponaria TaxID=32244 RepID=A0AAD7LGH9_QUISA|nr:Mucin-5AC like [Quillaja saponaria]